HQRAVEVDVLPAGEVGMEARPDLDQRPQPSAREEGPRRGHGDAGEDLQERALPRSVGADEPDDVAALGLERDVLGGPEPLAAVAAREQPARPLTGRVLDGAVPSALDPVALRHSLEGHRDLSHGGAPQITSANVRSATLKMVYPAATRTRMAIVANPRRERSGAVPCSSTVR